MLQFHAGRYLKAYFLMSQLEIASKDKAVHGIHVDAVEGILTQLDDLLVLLAEMNLELSLKTALELRAYFDKCRTVNALGMAGDLARRIHDELELRHLLALSPAERRLYEETSWFGADVASKFPSLLYEIGEASKCLALGRSTASAFHLIRSLEAVIRAISRCLHISDPIKGADRNWGKMLDLVKKEIDRRWPASSDRMAGDGRFFEESYGILASIKNPYRNATMHFDTKYTTEEAKLLADIVSGFTKKVASRCDESGEPKV